MNPQRRRTAAAFVLVASLIGWPTTALTVFKDEPQGILALSWLALTLTAADVLATTDVRAQDD